MLCGTCASFNTLNNAERCTSDAIRRPRMEICAGIRLSCSTTVYSLFRISSFPRFLRLQAQSFLLWMRQPPDCNSRVLDGWLMELGKGYEMEMGWGVPLGTAMTSGNWFWRWALATERVLATPAVDTADHILQVLNLPLIPSVQKEPYWRWRDYVSANLPVCFLFLEMVFSLELLDHAEPWQLGSQDAATPMMQGITDLHHDIFFFLILILVFVSRILVRALWHFHYQKNPIPQRIVHGTTIEILRTIFPSIIPMFIAIPSFALLYSMDEVVVDPAITIKAIGHQWYRTYEYSDYNSSDEQSLTFDSYTIPEDDLEFGQSRLLEVDNRVVVPAKTHLRIIVTPADVPHSWAVPSSGVKCDAVPGRLNQISISVQREGVYYGQPTAEPTLAQPHHPGCEPPEKQAITASGWSYREPRSKAVDKIEEGARLPVEQRRRNHGALHTEQASLRDETPAQGPQFSLGGRTKDLWKSGLPRPHGQRNSVLRKEAVSAEGEGPATAETIDPILVPSRLLRVREAWNPKYEGSLKIEKGGQGFRKGLTPLPGQDRWEGALSSKGHNQPLYLCWSYEAYLIIMKREKGFFSLLLAFSLPRGEGSLTYAFQAWRETKGLDFTYDQISLAFRSCSQLTLWLRRCREDLGVGCYFFGISLSCLCRRRFSSIRKRAREEDLSLLERESKRARLDEATSNQVAPETLSESPIVESSAIASPGSDTVSVEDSEQSLDPAPDSYSYLDGDLDSIHHSAGETLYNLLQKAGIKAPQSWTMPELAAEVFDAQGDIPYASEVLQDLLTHQVNSFYFEQTVELVRLIMG
uniref:cytochrome-c oxidase n=1 Tax=Fagus sylvatica TaxID=28930 RepID=A0A2N9G5D7_FAGSY